ncbi:hypothetical protein CTI12_AA579420 [Artemisia annua]|uniref:CCHC-type domain-containing protein n=1 Tax=Artemisia annua TaxID=35608 RepID=A0A2U1KPI4_ARTAN|nr:hypothetical protein CTI12_AA579420 [Artemisia annua]
MKHNESLDVYAGKISEIATQASSLGHTMDDKRLVRKLLSSVPEKFMQIVAAIEQFADLNTMPFQEAIGRLKAFEERMQKAVKEEDGSSNLLFSKVDEKEKTKEHKCERCGHENSSQGRPGRGQDKNWKPWKKKDGDQDLSQIRCYKCKEFGHYKGECPNKSTMRELGLELEVCCVDKFCGQMMIKRSRREHCGKDERYMLGLTHSPVGAFCYLLVPLLKGSCSELFTIVLGLKEDKWSSTSVSDVYVFKLFFKGNKFYRTKRIEEHNNKVPKEEN